MAPSFWQILIVLVLVVLLFGRGKISDLMGDVATGIKSFKKGLQDDEESGREPPHEPRTIGNAPAQPAQSARSHDTASASHKQETPNG